MKGSRYAQTSRGRGTPSPDLPASWNTRPSAALSWFAGVPNLEEILHVALQVGGDLAFFRSWSESLVADRRDARGHAPGVETVRQLERRVRRRLLRPWRSNT